MNDQIKELLKNIPAGPLSSLQGIGQTFQPPKLIKWKGYVEGPKWANPTKALFEGAVAFNLELKILDRDKGWIRETIYYQLEGTDKNIKGFNAQFEQALREYNES